MNEPRRILHVISRLDGYGGSAMLRQLAASQAAAKQRVVVAAFSADPATAHRLRDLGVVVQTLGSRWGVDPVAMLRLRRLRRQFPVDVTHAWDLAALAQLGYARSLRTGEPLVGRLSASELGGPRVVRRLRAALRRVAAWVVDADEPRSLLLRLGVSPDAIAGAPLGVPAPTAGSLSRASLLEQLSLPADARLIVMAGRLLRSKRLDEAIWSYELVRILHSSARLVVFGDGPDRSRLERFALLVSEPGCVLYPGFHADWQAVLPHADAYWQLDARSAPSASLLEALAAGAPVVASDGPAHRAVMRPGVDGLLVPVVRADVTRATNEILSDASLAERLGHAAREHMRTSYPLAGALDGYDQLYRRLSQFA